MGARRGEEVAAAAGPSCNLGGGGKRRRLICTVRTMRRTSGDKPADNKQREACHVRCSCCCTHAHTHAHRHTQCVVLQWGVLAARGQNEPCDSRRVEKRVRCVRWKKEAAHELRFRFFYLKGCYSWSLRPNEVSLRRARSIPSSLGLHWWTWPLTF